MQNKAGIAVFAALWLGYTGIKKLVGIGEKKLVEPFVVEKVLRELECQMFISCTHFAHVVESKMKQLENKTERESVKANLRLEMNKAYEDKRRRLLLKYDIEPELFTKSLEHITSSNIDCRHLMESMAHMMELALEGKVPDSNVPPQVRDRLCQYRRDFPPQKIITILRDMLAAIACTVYKEYKARAQLPDFSIEDFDKVMGKVDIQSIKEAQLKKQKFSKAKDNNPNMTFNKLLEHYKKSDQSVRHRLKHLEQKYQEVVENISIHINTLTEEDIMNMMRSINIQIQEERPNDKLNKSNLTSGPLSKISQLTEEEQNGSSPNNSIKLQSIMTNKSARASGPRLKGLETYSKMRQYSQLFTNRNVNPYSNAHNKMSSDKLLKSKSKNNLKGDD